MPKNTKKTCVFIRRGRSRDTKILNLIYHQSSIYCRSNKKKLGPYLLINYFKIKILKYLIFSFSAFSLIFWGITRGGGYKKSGGRRGLQWILSKSFQIH